ncbi:methylmalonyl-CoA mutase [bacterium MnTg02]|nr:methylmalonyl-CoA mutase [bacterium MnTg02]
MLAVVLSKKARARAVQLPAWNEAFGLPRPWDQQWSLRLQQIVAYETDLLEYADIFDGSKEIDRKVEELKDAARGELRTIESLGGAIAAVESGYMKEALVESNRVRLRAIESGEKVVVGVNCYQETEPSPLGGESGEPILTVSDHVEADQIAQLRAWCDKRDNKAAKTALEDLQQAARDGANIMPPSIACAKAGVTTGEWGQKLREVFGEYRAPTGISEIKASDEAALNELREAVTLLSKRLGRPLTFLVGKPGLDGHSNGAEQIAVRARDVGIETVYEGIRLTPEQIVKAASENDVHIVGLSILSGSHVPLVQDIMARMQRAGLDHIPIIVGGIIPAEDENILRQCGVAAIYTPKDFQLNEIMAEIVELVDRRTDAA